MKGLYHIMKIEDYKGGELLPTINCSFNQVCWDIWENTSLERNEFESEEDIISNVNVVFEEEIEIYAGNYSYCPTIFKSIIDGDGDMALIKVDIEDFKEGLINLLTEEFLLKQQTK